MGQLDGLASVALASGTAPGAGTRLRYSTVTINFERVFDTMGVAGARFGAAGTPALTVPAATLGFV